MICPPPHFLRSNPYNWKPEKHYYFVVLPALRNTQMLDQPPLLKFISQSSSHASRPRMLHGRLILEANLLPDLAFVAGPQAIFFPYSFNANMRGHSGLNLLLLGPALAWMPMHDLRTVRWALKYITTVRKSTWTWNSRKETLITCQHIWRLTRKADNFPYLGEFSTLLGPTIGHVRSLWSPCH